MAQSTAAARSSELRDADPEAGDRGLGSTARTPAGEQLRRRLDLDGYVGGEDADARPLMGYAVLGGIYVAATAGMMVHQHRSRRRAGDMSPGDMLLLGVATFRMSRIVTKDTVTSFVRAPFVRYVGNSPMHGEVEEEPRGTGLRRATGELLTCPYCTGQWIGTGMAFAMAAAPRRTRLVAASLALATVSNLCQLAYVRVTRAAAASHG